MSVVCCPKEYELLAVNLLIITVFVPNVLIINNFRNVFKLSPYKSLMIIRSTIKYTIRIMV